MLWAWVVSNWRGGLSVCGQQAAAMHSVLLGARQQAARLPGVAQQE